MGKVDFKLNLRGLNELMKSPEMQDHLHTAGAIVADNAGYMDYDNTTYVLRYVAVENIYPTSFKAAQDNRKNNTLLKALGSAGLSMKK